MVDLRVSVYNTSFVPAFVVPALFVAMPEHIRFKTGARVENSCLPPLKSKSAVITFAYRTECI